jgi:hypothetical protein
MIMTTSKKPVTVGQIGPRGSGSIAFHIPMRALKMEISLKLLLTAAAITIAVVFSSEPTFARGGPANIMSSPGYQRRLQESRQQLSQLDPQPSSAVRHKSRHRR